MCNAVSVLFLSSYSRFILCYSKSVNKNKSYSGRDKEIWHYVQEENKRRVPLSVDAPLGGRENINLLSLLVNTNAKDSDIDATSSSYMKLIIDVLDLLDKREREVITCFYGIRRDRLSLAEIAAQMCIKRERARQIRDKATRKIRKAIRKS